MSAEGTVLPTREHPSSSDEVERCLTTISRENDRLHAVSQLFAELARSRAADMDKYLAAGEVPGALQGLPLLVKELIDIAGQQTAFGSLAYATASAARNAPVIDRLEAAGAIILGTTHMVEFAIGGWGTNHAKGTPWNPADALVHHVPGGSSSGSAVAVAAGLVPAAIGSDTGGSIRIPASLCGVIGFKPTYGLIPTVGVAPLSPTFDTLGPITRTVLDARRLTEAMSGLDLGHPPVNLAGLRIAVVHTEALSPVSEDVEQAFRSAMALLTDQGAQIVEIELPLSFVGFQKLNGDIMAFEAYRNLAKIVEDPDTPLDPNARKRVLAGRDVSTAQYEERLAELAALRQAFPSTVASTDILALPGTPICAIPVAQVDESQIPMSRYTRVANCLDLCAISLPLARSAGAMPIGLQLCAPAQSDAFLLAVAEVVAAVCG